MYQGQTQVLKHISQCMCRYVCNKLKATWDTYSLFMCCVFSIWGNLVQHWRLWCAKC